MKNPYSDYSIGKNLFDSQPVPFLLLGSYSRTAILRFDQQHITTIYPGGAYEVTDFHAQPISSVKLDNSIYRKVFKMMHQF